MRRALIGWTIIVLAVTLAFGGPLATDRTVLAPPSTQVGVHTTDGPAGRLSPSQIIPFHLILQDYLSGYYSATNLVINDQSTWSNVWVRTEAGCVEYCPPVPTIDFSSRTVLAVFLGQRGTGGYTIEIFRVEQTGPVVTVRVKVTTPDLTPGACAYTQMIIEPVDIVDIPRTEAGVTFITETSVTSCV